MTNSTVSGDAADNCPDFATVTGVWALDPPPTSSSPLRPGAALRHLGALAVLFALSTLTSIQDPWLHERQRHAQSSVSNPFGPIRPRRLSVVQARRVALEVLRRAEQERLRVAQEEADRGIDWEAET